MGRLHDWAKKQPGKLAVQMHETGKALSYQELDQRANRVAEWLLSLGLEEGSVIALLLENNIGTFELWWGARRAGMYYVPISILLTGREAAYIVRDCGASVLITSAATTDLARETLEALGADAPPHRLMLDGEGAGFENYDKAMSGFTGTASLPEKPVGREFMYSSGTTGFPKGIRRPLLPYARRYELPELEKKLRSMFQLDGNSVFLSVSPLYHATGRFNIRVLECGGTCVIMRKFDAASALEAIARHRITHGHWVPTMFSRLLALPAEVRDRHDVSSQRVALHATAPCPRHVKEAMISWWGPIINEYYGGSENVGVTYIDAKDWLSHKGSVGKPICGEMHIMADDGSDTELPAGEIGLIYFNGGVGFQYHNDSEKTKSVFNRRGWGTYGDMGSIDSDGFLFMSDRRTDLIISGGVNIYPQEAENALLTHPAVEDVAVIGIPHEDYGQEVKAVVQLKTGYQPSDNLANELVAFCRTHLSRIKCPRTVDFVDALPRSENGKLLKRVLRDSYAAKPVTATTAGG
ncbi:MAG: AMP-binding protein [Polaromonas sp.]|uniref:AMP-binding protein n=1 Tax=Polaromonas sp. TaxID=1869339 RepID=UPI0025E1428F|nr:AMP-binding protein [Polaromonas sp.]MBI2726367.1 AMP-binding protein [Polaromonas sp.]